VLQWGTTPNQDKIRCSSGKPRSWLGTGTKSGWVKPINVIHMVSSAHDIMLDKHGGLLHIKYIIVEQDIFTLLEQLILSWLVLYPTGAPYFILVGVVPHWSTLFYPGLGWGTTPTRIK
jgi:hypothetical protein